MAEGGIECTTPAAPGWAPGLGWPCSLRLRELAVEPPLIRGKRMADGKLKPRMECSFETVAFGTSGLAERWPISKPEVEIRGVLSLDRLPDHRGTVLLLHRPLLIHRSISLLLFLHGPVFLLFLPLWLSPSLSALLISSAISCGVGGDEPFS